jgi:hypothetical protein
VECGNSTSEPPTLRSPFETPAKQESCIIKCEDPHAGYDEICVLDVFDLDAALFFPLM